jgi:fructose-specific phosphotransferase system IIC component
MMPDNWLKALMISLLLTCLVGVMACVTTSGPINPTAPGSAPQQTDPEFWKQWGSSRGLGG